ncbi:pilus assembly PilX family protein [Dyella choica]|uniref:Type 4 fimbrial biogenesis protein PilX N-terminal domain-containing protein n=1 Tax=Dyella choica TaxID=1927959 RepID=A0A3S0PMM1_9GAMM|nr:PilX N-terminal domain-containing pilus assembly protein [Dyella choica]RUL74042.1 hypothetical protein EKH80_14510 [Dyella choica]
MSCTRTTTSYRSERGFVLIASLLMLVILSLLAISMYHNVAIQENVASNTKEKGRAFQLAQSTLQYAEYSLLNNSSTSSGLPAAVACPSGTALTKYAICNNAADITTPSTANAAMTISNGMTYSGIQGVQISSTGGASTFYSNPVYQLRYLGPAPGGVGQIYQVTALGYGATANAVAAVQSTYELSSGVKNLGGL